jgi:hypothetical protein
MTAAVIPRFAERLRNLAWPRLLRACCPPELIGLLLASPLNKPNIALIFISAVRIKQQA